LSHILIGASALFISCVEFVGKFTILIRIFLSPHNKYSSFENNVMSTDPKQLICELGAAFYNLGWVSGTGGGISIKDGEQVYIAPSGVQKECILPEQIFTLDSNRNILSRPDNLTLSACAPIFFEIYDRTNSGAVIHNHSIHAARASLAFDRRFKITGIEMQKGIGGYDVFDLLHVPIIENVSHEKDLATVVGKTIAENTDTSAILVRGHGVYVWGRTWEHAKTQAECYDYLFRISLEESARGLDLSKPIRRYERAYRLDTATPLTETELRQHGIALLRPTSTDTFLTDLASAGYDHLDTVSITPVRGIEEKLFAFEREHKHHEDEIRFITNGEGIFDIRDNNDHWIRIEVEIGDLLRLPAGRYHRFFLTQEKKIKATRFFQDKEGWIPEYRRRN